MDVTTHDRYLNSIPISERETVHRGMYDASNAQRVHGLYW